MRGAKLSQQTREPFPSHGDFFGTGLESAGRHEFLGSAPGHTQLLGRPAFRAA